MDIVDLNNNGEIEGQDLIPIFSQDNAANRSVSFNVLKKAVPTIESISYQNPTLTITMTDGSFFELDLV